MAGLGGARCQKDEWSEAADLRRSRPRRCGSLGSGSHQNVETRAAKLIQPAKTLTPHHYYPQRCPFEPGRHERRVVHKRERREGNAASGGWLVSGGW